MGSFDTAWRNLPGGATPGSSDYPITAEYLTAVDTQMRTERSDRVPDALLTKLDQASASAVIVVLGDSTGVPGTNWPDDLAALIGARWPTHKVTMRSGGGGYGAPTTIANASATLTLDIYNGSVSGTVASSPIGAISSYLPVRPDLILINYGHNHGADSPATFQAAVDSLVAAARGVWADVPVVVTSQNPRFGVANIAEHAAREQAKRAWTATRGYGYVPGWEAFYAQANPAAYVADGIHPTTSGATDGSALWAKAVDAYLAGRTRRPSAAATTGGGIAGVAVQDENVTLSSTVTQFDFQGAGVTAALGSGGEVVVTIPGSTGGGTATVANRELLMQDGVTAPPVPLETEARTDWLYQD